MPHPYYILAASVPPGNRIKGFYQEGSSAPALSIERPPSFRYAGFDLTTGDYAKLIDDRWQVQNGDRKLIQLFQDGTLLCRLRADGEFLGWGSQNLAIKEWLNPVAVVESHASFAQLYDGIVGQLLRRPSELRFTLRFANGVVDGKLLAITRYYSSGIQHVHMPQLYRLHAPDASDELVVDAALVTKKPEHLAFRLLEKLYEMFDAGPDIMPFATMVNREARIDVAAIQAL